MKYFYTPKKHTKTYGKLYFVDHPYYRRCTLYEREGKGLLVVKKVFNPITKKAYWDAINPDLATDIYLNENFHAFFKEHAKPPEDGFYPIFDVRKLMWALRMKPLKREEWEKFF